MWTSENRPYRRPPTRAGTRLVGAGFHRTDVALPFHRVETDWATSFRDATFDFIDAVIDGRPPRLDASEARATLAFALAAQRSAAEQREVRAAELG